MADAGTLYMKRLKNSFHKLFREKNIFLYTPILGGNISGIYSGKIYINVPARSIEVECLPSKGEPNPIAAPDKARLGGIEFIIEYKMGVPEKIATKETIDQMYKDAKKSAKKGKP